MSSNRSVLTPVNLSPSRLNRRGFLGLCATLPVLGCVPDDEDPTRTSFRAWSPRRTAARSMTVRRAVHTLWFIARQSDDVPGDWEAHCLEFDLLSQGRTAHEALELCLESAAIHVRESLRGGHDPYDTRADDEFWKLRNSIVHGGEQLNPQQFHDTVHGNGNWIIAAEFSVRVDIDFHVADGAPSGQEPSPLVWKKAA